MVTGINDKVTIQDVYHHVAKGGEPKSPTQVDESGNPVVVSKDFILNLLSLAIGGPLFLEGDLGEKVDVKI